MRLTESRVTRHPAGHVGEAGRLGVSAVPDQGDRDRDDNESSYDEQAEDGVHRLPMLFRRVHEVIVVDGPSESGHGDWQNRAMPRNWHL